MDLLLVLEHHFYKDTDNNIWCDRVINREFIERYLTVFENITICARINEGRKIEDNFQKVSGKNTYFLGLPDFTGLKQMIIYLPKIIKIFNSEYRKFNTIIFRAPSPLSLVLYRFCINKNNKIGVEFVMGADKFFPDNGMLLKLINRAIVKEAKKICLKANGVSYVTSQYLQKIYPSYSIKYGKDSKHIDSYYSSVDLKDYNFIDKKWTSNDKPKVYKIVHIGYMDNNRKGHEILIKALSIVKAKKFNIESTFVGDGKMRTKFEKLAKNLEVSDNIIFYGATNDKREIVDILRTAHLLVLPSKSEGLPRVIIEAMAASTPCIASGVDGIPELLNSNCIVNSFDPNEYAEKIIEVLSDWEKMIKYSVENFENAKRYHEKVLNNRRNKFYLELKNMDLTKK